MRQIHNLIQGSPEWHAHRNTPGIFNGSELATIMGIGSYKSRSALLREKATGITEEIDAAKQKRFDDGHRYEALARPLAEGIIDDDLSAMVMSDEIDGVLLSVSLDGITQCKGTTFEHKGLNIVLSDALDAGFLPDEYHPQCEAGLMVSGATRCLFMASKWDIDDNLIDKKHYWYESRPALRPRIIAACKQFADDLANYEHVEAAPAAVAAPIKDLPALVITATGSLSVETNFAKWEIELRDFIKRIPEKPSTDQEFEDCKAAVAAFKKAEAALDAEEARVLTMVPSVDDMRRHKKLLRDLSSTTRLALEKLVVQRDIDVKKEIIRGGQDRLDAHINALNQRIGGQWMPRTDSPFAAAIKNKRSYASMRNSVDDALANAKTAANEIADTIQANRSAVPDELIGVLMPDFAQVCTKDRLDFANLLASRVAAYKEAEEKRLEAERTKQNAQEVSVAAGRSEGVAPEAPALSKEPTGEASMPGGSVATGMKGIVPTDLTAQPVSPITDESIIDDFIRLLSIGIVEKKALRPHLLAWEKYRIAREMAVAA